VNEWVPVVFAVDCPFAFGSLCSVRVKRNHTASFWFHCVWAPGYTEMPPAYVVPSVFMFALKMLVDDAGEPHPGNVGSCPEL
jgi:hypothetical protein